MIKRLRGWWKYWLVYYRLVRAIRALDRFIKVIKEHERKAASE